MRELKTSWPSIHPDGKPASITSPEKAMKEEPGWGIPVLHRGE